MTKTLIKFLFLSEPKTLNLLSCLRVLVFFIFSLFTTLLLTSCSDKPNNQALPAGSLVVALGDSLTYAYGATPDTAYPVILANLTGWEVVNAGVSGDTSADVLARTDDIVAQNPDLVLLGVGGNDVLQRIQPATTSANITATIDKFQSADIPVVLIAEPYFSTSALFGKASDNPIYEEIADAEQVPLYAKGWSSILSDDSLKSDQIHANAAGYAAFANGLYEYLQDNNFSN